MLRVLERESRALLEGDNPNFGARVEAQLRDALARTPEGAHGRSVQLLRNLGLRLLMEGKVHEAIEAYLEAERIVAAAPDAADFDAAGLAFDLGVAYLRLGEVDNCTLMHNADRCLLPIRGEGVHERKEGSRKAIARFERVLADRGAFRWHTQARWLLNVAQMTVGGYPERVAPLHRISESAFLSQEPIPRFHDVAADLGLDSFTLSGGVAVEDFDGDGHLDLMVSDWHPRGQLRFFRRRPDGGFADETETAGLKGLFGGLNLVQGDYDGDGDVDVLVLRGAWLREWGRQPNSLLRNEGDGRFVDVTFAAGLSPPDYPTQTAAWADFDNDGDLDVYVGNEHSAGRIRSPSQLFRNEGDGRFVDVAATAGVENFAYTKGVAWGDYDGDGWIDLYVSNFVETNRLYRNLGDGRFRDVAVELGVEEPVRSFPVWFWDYDNDGHLDLYVSASRIDGTDEVVAGYWGRDPRSGVDRIYRNDGAGGFEEMGHRLGLRWATMPMGASFGDLDNDGFLDFYLGTGLPDYAGLMPNLMLRNRSGTGFSDVTTAGGFGHLQKGHGVAFADLDNDGDEDVFAEMGGAFAGDAFMNALFENPGFGRRWLKLRLVGLRSNRSAIGARLRVDVREGGRLRSIHRQVGNGSSFGGNPLLLHVGLGGAERVEGVEVRWPVDGRRQRFEGLVPDRAYELEEDADSPRALSMPPLPFGDAPRPPGAGHEHHGAVQAP